MRQQLVVPAPTGPPQTKEPPITHPASRIRFARRQLGAAALLALLVLPTAAQAADHEYVVILDEGTNVSAKVRAEEARSNAVSDVFRSGVDGFVAELSASDVARLRADPAVQVVERNRIVHTLDGAGVGSVPAGAKVGSVIPGRYIVTVTAGSEPTALAAANGATPFAVFTHAINGFAAELSATQVARLAKLRTVVRIEPDRVVGIDTTQSSPPWGLDRIDQRLLPLDSQYNYTLTGTGVTAYIIDTGILSTHTQFTGRMGTGVDEVGGGTSDCHGHGTHVAGTVGGSTYGVAKGVTLVPVRVLSCSGSGSTAGVVAGIDWVVADHAAGTPAVANMSLGGGASATLDDAVQRGITDGVVFAVAAGNSTTDACTASPARAPAAITVGATDSTDARAYYSNYGTCVDIFAPGSGILSSWWTSTTATNTISGTSMATPHVAGAAALLLAADPTATPATIRTRLIANATASVISDAGTGSPNLLLASRALASPPVTLPGAPSRLAAVAGNARVTLSFDLPTDAGGSVITDYVIQQSLSGGAWTTVNDGVSGTTGATITGLTNGTSYAFQVAAVNSAGQGSFAGPISATPAVGLSNDDLADAATITGTTGATAGTTASATREAGEPTHGGVGGSASIWYRWTAPDNGTLTLTTQGSTFDTLLGIYTGTTIAGLTRLADNDDAPGGLWSTVSITVTSGTSYAIAIDGYGGTRGTTTLNRSFAVAPPAPANDPLAGAIALSGPTGATVGSTASATREAGEPTHGGAGGSASIWYRWTAPTNGTLTVTTQGSTFDTLLGIYTGTTIAGLARLADNDDAGGGLWSRVAITVTSGTSYAIAIDGYGGTRGATTLNRSFAEAGVPSAPTNATGTAGNAQIIASWSAPASNGGSTITSYTAKATPGTATCSSSGARTCTIRGLANGTAYTITVTATNASGTSVDSSPSAPVTPGTSKRTAAASWGLDRIDQRSLPLDGIMSLDAAGVVGGAGVTAYIVDTGVWSEHTQFSGRIQSGFVSVNNGSDDGHGTEDCYGHGTHVAGTVGGRDYGVAPAVAIVPVRVLDCTGSGYLSDVIAGLDWAARDHVAGAPAVANMSLGGGYSEALNAAVNGLIADGVTVVVAAGNEDANACEGSPSSTPAAITVGATDSNDRRASFSNFGPCVDVFAPGVDILSAGLDSPTATATMSGTSMATPHVVGAVALLLEASPGATPAQIAAAVSINGSSGIVGDPGPGSPNTLLFIGSSSVPQLPPAPAPAPGTGSPRPPAGGHSAAETTVAPRVAAARLVGGKLQLVLTGGRGALYKIYRDGKLVMTTTSAQPRLVIGKGRRIVFRVRILRADGLSDQSNKVIIAGGRIQVQAVSGR